MNEFDLIVVGGGLAGYTAARKGTERGARVLLVEKDAVGGRSRGYHALCRLSRAGVSPKVDGLQLIAAARKAGETLSARWTKWLEEAGVSVKYGAARLAGRGGVTVEGPEGVETMTGRGILIATGSVPIAPTTLPFDGHQTIASDALPELDRVPASALVIGEERAGVETALLFRALGTAKVFLLSGKPRLLPDEAMALTEALEAGMKRRKVKLLLGKRIISIYRNGDDIDVTLDGGVKFSTGIIVQTGGRRGQTDELGAEELGMRLGQDGEILVDEALRTSVPGVFAAGSVLGRPSYESLTEEEAKIAALCALGLDKKLDPGWVPRIIHSNPEIASIGCYYETAHHLGFRAVEGRCVMEDIDGAELRGDEGGWVRIVADKTTARVIGAQMVLNRASDLIPMISLALRKGLTVETLKGICCDGSSAARGIKEAARACSEALKNGRAGPGWD
jgi:dihydrolipoamide dehydrogenase